MKRFFIITLTLFLVLSLVTACGSSKQGADSTDKNQSKAEKIVIKVGHGNPESNAIHQGWVKFKELVEEKSNGNMEVKIYPNGQLGGDRELIEALQMGNITMGSPSSAPLASFDKEFFVLDIPFMFKDREAAYKALDGEAGKELLKTLESFNIKGLAFMENGFRNLTNSRNPVKTPEDLDGLKIRTMENEIHLSAWSKLGANPTPMAFGELFTALQQKTVDGQENPFELIYSVKFHEVQKYISKTQHIYSPYVIIINKDFYANLSDENKEIINECVTEATNYQRELAKAKDMESEEAIKEAGVEVIELSDTEKGMFKEKLVPLYDEVKKKSGEKIVELFINATK